MYYRHTHTHTQVHIHTHTYTCTYIYRDFKIQQSVLKRAKKLNILNRFGFFNNLEIKPHFF